MKPAILFVCLGNICRSPTAEGVFRELCKQRNLADKLTIDSAGTAAWHVGKSPDPRSTAAALNRRIDLSSLRGRQVTIDDFNRFDFILAMDKENLGNLQQLAPKHHRAQVQLFLDFANNHPEDEVPDPYYGGEAGFEHVLDLAEDASIGLLNHLQAKDTV